jgi:beta-mannosidase
MRISLNGNDWIFKGYIGEDWNLRNSYRPGTRDRRGWHTGRVPGSVQNDLWRSGEIPDPYFERNSLLSEWAPQRTWLYKKNFRAGEELQGKRLSLCFEGVDYEAKFFLNGEYLGEHCGMFTPVAFDVSERIRCGEENLLAVVLEPAPAEQPQVGRTSRVQTFKSRMTYWWDFCPRMIHVGIWDDVYLEATGPARVEDIYVHSELSSDFRRANLSMEIHISAGNVLQPEDTAGLTKAAAAFPVEIQADIYLDNQVVDRQNLQVEFQPGDLQTFHLNSEILDPALWWPNGYGEQPLYQLDVRLITQVSSSEDPSVESDRRRIHFGIRRIEMIPNENAGQAARPYTLQVNGCRIFAKGWNWVPMDVMYGVERPEKLRRLLTLARRAHVNLLRVWGGGLIEKEAFYDQCDRYGILVWQEFIQSSSGIDNTPPSSPEFIEMIAGQAEQIIPGKRNHPSLALWCGGNELQSSSNIPLDGNHPAIAELRKTVHRLDPGRAWLPSSPSGPVFGFSMENMDRDPDSLHDVHGPWERQGLSKQYELYNRSGSLLHSEFGVEGITNLKTLDRVIAKEHQWPASLDNPLWEHLGAWWVRESMWQEMFGELSEVNCLARATQLSQADGLRYSVEADRRRKYHNSGTIPWQFNEPYPMAACTSAVDYYAFPKPAYYAVAKAFEPVHLSAKFPTIAWDGKTHFEAEVWASNSKQRCFCGVSLKMRLVGASGKCYLEQSCEVSLGADASSLLGVLNLALVDVKEDVFFLDLHLELPDSFQPAENRYVFTKSHNLAALFRVPQTRLEVEKEECIDRWTIKVTNTGSQTALFVWLEEGRPSSEKGWAYFDRNYFCLFPGETHQIKVDWENVPAMEREISLCGWNTPEARIYQYTDRAECLQK